VFSFVGRKAHEELSNRRPRPRPGPASLPGRLPCPQIHIPNKVLLTLMHRSVPAVKTPDPDLRITTPGLTHSMSQFEVPKSKSHLRVVVVTHNPYKTSFGF
jgi:hypothetical protein